jgi:hypothetical protein
MFKKVLFLLLLLITTGVNSAVPNLINYQGKLTDANGEALATGDYDLTFKIYDATNDGTLKWSEIHTSVPVVKGFFNVILGGVTDITSAFDTENSYLEITVNDGNPILPRQRVLSSPYAINSNKVGGVTKDNIMPIGSIIAWHKSLTGVPSLPDGWVECNGGTVNDISSPLNGQAIPDLNSQVYAGDRGRYLRGGTVSGVSNDSTYWSDNGNSYGGELGGSYGTSYAYFHDLDAESSSQLSYSEVGLGSTRRFQVAAMTVVWIMRIK